MVETRAEIYETLPPKTPEVWVHTGNFFPWSAVVKNETLLDWARKSGADKLEWMAVGPITPKLPLGPTHEVLVKPVKALQQIFGTHLGHGHDVFNPYATLWNILTRRPDLLRPGEPIALYNLLVSRGSISQRALQKLEIVKNGKFPVVVYPRPARLIELEEAFLPSKTRPARKYYKESLLQTHPAIFDDSRTADQIIRAVKAGEYLGVCVDLYHFREATSLGVRPFGKSKKELFKTLEKFYRSEIIGEVHVQPGRLISLDQTIDSKKDLLGVFDADYNTPLGKMLKFLVHDLGFLGPYTSEIDPRALVDIYGKKILLPPGRGKILEAQRTVVNYIREA